MGYAVVLGEALVDLLETTVDGEPAYRQVIGGGPLNVSVGVARLGGDVEFAGSVGADVLGDRIARTLVEAGVGTKSVRRVTAPSALAVATYEGAEPEFHFYGEPPSYALLTPEDIPASLIAGAAVLYAGSIALLREPFVSAARHAWRQTGPIRVFDPNVRPRLLPDVAAVNALRDLVEGFMASADVVKLSAADAAILYGGASPEAAAQHIRELGARSVVVTMGARGAFVSAGDGSAMVAAPTVSAVDATGAGDSVMAALIRRLLADGIPADLAGWQRNVRYALAVGGLVVERHGGAASMPTEKELLERWGPLD
jgi:fructokinase